MKDMLIIVYLPTFNCFCTTVTTVTAKLDGPFVVFPVNGLPVTS